MKGAAVASRAGRYAWNDRGRHINGNNVHKATAFRHKTHLAADPQEPPVNFRRIAMMADSVAADGVEPVNGYRQPPVPGPAHHGIHNPSAEDIAA